MQDLCRVVAAICCSLEHKGMCLCRRHFGIKQVSRQPINPSIIQSSYPAIKRPGKWERDRDRAREREKGKGKGKGKGTGKGKGKRERGRGKEKGMGKGQGKGKGKEEGEGEREWERERDKDRERGIAVLCRQKRSPENKKYRAERSPFF